MTTEMLRSDAERRLSKKALNRSFWTWYHGSITGYNHQVMEGMSFATAMVPIVEDLYDTEEEKRDALQTYQPLFNTEMHMGFAVVGITASLEESKARGNEAVTPDMINGVRTSLMGPLAGMGDSLIPGTYVPILLSIALGLSAGGSVLGPLFYIIAWNVTMLLFVRFLFTRGYRLGVNSAKLLVGRQAMAIRESMVMLGSIVIGALAATWITITTSFTIDLGGTHVVDGEEVANQLHLQDTLDGILPGLLSLLLVLFAWFLLAKLRISPPLVMLIFAVIAFLGVLLGFFDPGLTSY
ncbi:PTS system mannose/fructose/sorbose family transporter subunit IID [Microbacterium sp.]|uniref:PTS system mannose/fructose/sorbose family transporter subunit IID n=1 Tax=Microbacterium sp. TaxID=51671 RepID=UPI0039E2EF7E